MQAASQGFDPFVGPGSLTKILETSYCHATARQQAMFLDAALFLRGDLTAHLVGFWTGLIMHDRMLSASDAEWIAEEELARLVELSLVSCNIESRCGPQPPVSNSCIMSRLGLRSTRHSWCKIARCLCIVPPCMITSPGVCIQA